MERLIFHVDVNSAFLSWETAKRVKEGCPENVIQRQPLLFHMDFSRLRVLEFFVVSKTVLTFQWHQR